MLIEYCLNEILLSRHDDILPNYTILTFGQHVLISNSTLLMLSAKGKI